MRLNAVVKGQETIRLEVRVENETVWLTQAQMAELFQTTRNNITLHVGNIFKEGELEDSASSSLASMLRARRFLAPLRPYMFSLIFVPLISLLINMT